MGDFFRAGGVGMFPTLLFGFLCIAASVLYVLQPVRRSIGLCVSLGVATVAAGTLNFALGLMLTFRYIEHVPAAEQFATAAAGCEESLHNIVLALIPIVLAALICAVGNFRLPRGMPA